MNEIVKVQRPLFSTETSPGWMIYEHDQERVTIVPITSIPAHVRKAFNNGATKAYFQAKWNSSAKVWTLGTQVRNEEW